VELGFIALVEGAVVLVIGSVLEHMPPQLKVDVLIQSKRNPVFLVVRAFSEIIGFCDYPASLC